MVFFVLWLIHFILYSNIIFSNDKEQFEQKENNTQGLECTLHNAYYDTNLNNEIYKEKQTVLYQALDGEYYKSQQMEQRLYKIPKLMNNETRSVRIEEVNQEDKQKSQQMEQRLYEIPKLLNPKENGEVSKQNENRNLQQINRRLYKRPDLLSIKENGEIVKTIKPVEKQRMRNTTLYDSIMQGNNDSIKNNTENNQSKIENSVVYQRPINDKTNAKQIKQRTNNLSNIKGSATEVNTDSINKKMPVNYNSNTQQTDQRSGKYNTPNTSTNNQIGSNNQSNKNTQSKKSSLSNSKVVLLQKERDDEDGQVRTVNHDKNRSVVRTTSRNGYAKDNKKWNKKKVAIVAAVTLTVVCVVGGVYYVINKIKS